MKHILVPTDFSEAAKNAVEYAKYLAIEFDAKVTLVYIHSVPVDPLRIGEISDEVLGEAREVIKRGAARLKDTGLRVETKVVLGDTIGRLKEEIFQTGADLIVMGCQGEHYLPTRVFGSTTTTLMDEVRVPIIAVPEDFPPDLPEYFVWSTDRTPPKKATTLRPLLELVERAGTELKVFHYQKKGEDTLPYPRFKELLEGVVAYDFFSQADDGEEIEEAINEFSEMVQTDLIAVIHRRSNWLSKLMVVSSTRRTVWSSPVPVLILQER